LELRRQWGKRWRECEWGTLGAGVGEKGRGERKGGERGGDLESPGAVVVIASLLIKRCKEIAFRVGVFREMSRMIVFLLFSDYIDESVKTIYLTYFSKEAIHFLFLHKQFLILISHTLINGTKKSIN
jgi:hypothetical protein